MTAIRHKNLPSLLTRVARWHFSLAAAVLIALSSFQQAVGQDAYEKEHPLKSDARIERSIAHEQMHIYKLKLGRGDLVRIRVDQIGINVVLIIARDVPGRKVLKQVNSSDTNNGSELLTFLAETPGDYVVGVYGHAPDGKEGRYLLQNSAHLNADESRKVAVEFETSASAAHGKKDLASALLYREAALKLRLTLPRSVELASLLFSIGLTHFESNEHQKAIDVFEKAAAAYSEFEGRDSEALAYVNIAASRANLKDYKGATEYLERARAVFTALKDAAALLDVELRLGDIAYQAQDLERAVAILERVLAKQRELKDRNAEARTLSRLGFARISLEEPLLALANFEKALGIHRELKNRLDEGFALNGLSYARSRLDRHIQSLDAANEALKIGVELSDRVLEIGALHNVGNAQLMLGRYEESLATHRRALALSKEAKNRSYEATSTAYVGIVHAERGDYDRAITYYLDAIAIDRENNDKASEAVNLANLGEIYMRLGNFRKAEETTLRSVTLRAGMRPQNGDSFTFTNLGTIYMRLGQPEKAGQYFEKALEVVRGKAAAFQVIYAKIYYGKLHREQRRLAQAIKLHTEALAEARSSGIRKYESFADHELSLDYLEQGDGKRAAEGFERALVAARSVNARDQAAAALEGLMNVSYMQGKKDMAIFFGKQSINLLQDTRGDIAKVDKETHTHFIRDNEQVYRRLAEILIAEGRLPEAQNVLGLLKEEELSGFVRRDAKEIEALSKRADLRANERSALEKFSAISAKITAVGTELATLEEKRRNLPSGESFPEQARYDELTAQIKAANAAFRIFLEKELAAELGAEKKREVDADRALQGRLRQWGEGTVAISTIVGGDRYRIILTTANVQVDGRSEITAAELNKKVFAFRETLLDPNIDPRPLGKELYDLLVKPIEKDLTASGAKTLLWSLDGTLRYIPVAALWDGERYLAEKYQNVIVTSTTRQSLQANVVSGWSVLGAGVTKASQVTDALTSRKIAFDELAGVGRELNAILSSAGPSAAQGVSLIDAAFTEEALKRQLTQTVANKRRFNVIHFATHFKLGSDTTDSFLLLGGDKTLTLAEVADSPEMDLTDVELVTLSACNTGFGGIEAKKALAENNGKEVDSLAQFIELRGAKSVMATLWAVVDESTALIMGEFYRLRAENPKWTKAEALRRAQIALITGEKKGVPMNKRRSDPIDMGDNAPSQPSFKKDAAKPFAHPHYWAPFVLIGNWR